MASKNLIERKLDENLKPQFMELKDLSDGCGSKYHLIIVSQEFHGKTLLQRHRLVNSLLADVLKKIHAFSQATYTPDEWMSKGEAQGN